jgi:hypothetical protein
VERVVTLPPAALALADVLNQYDPEQLARSIIATLALTAEQRQELEPTTSLSERLKRVLELLRTQAASPAPSALVRQPADAPPPAATASPEVAPALLSEEQRAARRASALASLAEGQSREAVVREIVHLGAVVDLGGVNGWLPLEEMSWSVLGHPSDGLRVGDKFQVMVLQFDAARGKVVVGRRQLLPDDRPPAQEGGGAAA